MKKLKLIDEDQMIVLNKNELINLLIECKTSFKCGAWAMETFDIENNFQQKLREDYTKIFLKRADSIGELLDGLD